MRGLGVAPGDYILVHAALRSVGKVIGGADMILAALRDAVGPGGTILGYTDWDGQDDIDAFPTARDDIPPFDPLTSRAIRDVGFFPEMLRTTPGAFRSASPGASMAAIGALAEWFTADHALDYGYGPQSPLGKLLEVGGKTLMLGAPLDTMTLLHHAEHLADFPDKRVHRYETPILVDGRTVWRHFEEFDTADPPDGLADDYFAAIVTDFLVSGKGRQGHVGEARSVLVEAREIVPFAVSWIERALKPGA